MALTKLQSKPLEGDGADKMQYILTYIWLVTYLYYLENGTLMPISYKNHISHQITHSSVIDILCQPIRELFTSECQNLCRNTFLLHTEKYLWRSSYKIYINFFLSRSFSSPIIMVSKQCLDVCRQCLEISIWQDVTSNVQTMSGCV